MRAGQIVEVNGVREIFANPQHPYTRLLMDSLPSIDRKEPLLVPTNVSGVEATVVKRTPQVVTPVSTELDR
jgi:oligopeptide/dipeptide ABC transporter ATP-binding protein